MTFREVLNEETIPTGSVSLVLTDPMYGRDHLPVWSDLCHVRLTSLEAGTTAGNILGTNLPPVCPEVVGREPHLRVGCGCEIQLPGIILP